MIEFVKKLICLTSDSSELQVRKLILFFISFSCVFCGAMWGGLYWFFLGNNSLIPFLPFSFAIGVGLAILLLLLTKQIQILLFAQIILIMLIPALLQIFLGGKYEAGQVILWAILGPIVSLIYQGAKKSFVWVIIYLSLLVFMLVYNSDFAKFKPSNLEAFHIEVFSYMNLIFPCTVTIVGMVFFVSQAELEKTERISKTKSLLTTTDLIGKIQQTAREINTISKKTKTNVEFLFKESAQISNGADNQLNQIVLAEESLGELRKTSKSIASDAESQFNEIKIIQGLTNNLTNLNQDAIKNSKLLLDIITKATWFIKEGTESMNLLKSSITKMEEDFKKINDVGQVVTEIADNINLLSLNASIEAARAGEFGLGFTVVAREVSKLATETFENLKKSDLATRSISKSLKNSAVNMETSHKNFYTVSDQVNDIMRIIHSYTKIQEEQMRAYDKITSGIISLFEKSDTIKNFSGSQVSSVNLFSENVRSLKLTSTEFNQLAASLNKVAEDTSQNAKILDSLIDEMNVE